MVAAVRKRDKKQETSDKKAASAESSSEPKEEAVVVSDVVTETTERIEVIEEVTPEPKSETETPAESAPEEATPAQDPLTDFKEKMSEEEEQPVSSVPPQKNFMWPILFVFIIALAVLGGIFIYKQGANKTPEVNVVTLTPSPIPSPTPMPAVDLSKYSIKILNGSEVSGEAGRQKDNLEGEGFTVSSVGNAANSDYTQTIIQAKSTVNQAFLDKLKSVLEETFTVGEIETLSEGADSSVVVILGTKK